MFRMRACAFPVEDLRGLGNLQRQGKAKTSGGRPLSRHHQHQRLASETQRGCPHVASLPALHQTAWPDLLRPGPGFSNCFARSLFRDSSHAFCPSMPALLPAQPFRLRPPCCLQAPARTLPPTSREGLPFSILFFSPSCRFSTKKSISAV